MAYTAIGRIRFRMRGAWASGTAYEVMDVVRNAAGTIAYMAVKDVPGGTALTNGEYWAVLADVSTLKGEKGETGAQGEPGEKGETGAQGAQGAKGETGSPGADGADGVSVVMGYVDGDGHLQITLSDGTVLDAGDVKGEKGDQGQGVTILGSYDSESELTDAHPTGSAGDAYLVSGSLYVWSATGSEWVNVGSIKGEKGDPGEDGADGTAGYTPVRGTDYWTEADKAEIRAYVDEAILGGEW